MINNELLYLPVSLGEAIDKLTILDIKLDKISDIRKNDVKNEYDLLYNKLEEFIIKYENLYKIMKKINLLIWDMMDSLRNKDLNDKVYLEICKETIEYNDIRFRVKNKINNISRSILKEQKSYDINRLIIIINKEINDNLYLSNIIKYMSFIYDEINIISDFNLNYLQNNIEYDNSVIFKRILSENIKYKNKIILEDNDYLEDELYKIFNVTKEDLNKII